MDGEGLFCGNFCSTRGSWRPCMKVWCGSCYAPLNNNEFPVTQPMDEGGFEIIGSSVQDQFLKARNVGYLVTPCQCNLCHFRNLMSQNPIPGLPQDIRGAKIIWWANLDALWSHELTAVSVTMTTCCQGACITGSSGFKDKLFRSMGPFTLEDTIEIRAAIIMLKTSLRPGKYDKHVPFRTVRKFRSSFSNAYHASVEGQQATVMAKDTWKLTVIKCPTYG